MQSSMTIERNAKAELEITTPAVSNPGVAVELEPGCVSGG